MLENAATISAALGVRCRTDGGLNPHPRFLRRAGSIPVASSSSSLSVRLACGQRRALTTGKHQHQRELNDARERASAEGKIETMSPYPTRKTHERDKAVWANDRWTSRAMILVPGSFQVQQPWEPAGDTTTTDPRSQRNRASRRGRPDNNSSSQLIRYYGLPAIRAPDTPIPAGRW